MGGKKTPPPPIRGIHPKAEPQASNYLLVYLGISTWPPWTSKLWSEKMEHCRGSSKPPIHTLEVYIALERKDNLEGREGQKDTVEEKIAWRGKERDRVRNWERKRRARPCWPFPSWRCNQSTIARLFRNLSCLSKRIVVSFSYVIVPESPALTSANCRVVDFQALAIVCFVAEKMNKISLVSWRESEVWGLLRIASTGYAFISLLWEQVL